MSLYSRKFDDVADEPIEEQQEEEVAVKPKRVQSEAQKAGLLKAQEARKRKREEAASDVGEPEPVADIVPVVDVVEEKVEPPVVKEKVVEVKKVVVNDEEPPAWFKKHVLEETKRKDAKAKTKKAMEKKTVTQEKKVVPAPEPADNGRERVNTEYNQFLDYKYRMMFGR